MTVFTGEGGYVELRRTHGTERPSIAVSFNGSDVSVEARRFSVMGNEPSSGYFLTTGDRVEIKLADPMYKSNVQYLDKPWLIKDHKDDDDQFYTDWAGYVNVDAMGGIRLYTTYSRALEGGVANALELESVKPPQTEGKESPGTWVRFTQANAQYRCISHIQSYDFTTERETVDCTRLGDAFRKQYEAGLITGQGTLNCFWDYRAEMCHGNPDAEFSHYLSQLCIRIHTGAMFTGRFVLHYDGANSVFYEAACVVTNASVAVEPGQAITSNIQFVTTDVIQLRVGQVPGGLLVEGGGSLLDEDSDPVWQDD